MQHAISQNYFMNLNSIISKEVNSVELDDFSRIGYNKKTA